jgi:hypothetical protein
MGDAEYRALAEARPCPGKIDDCNGDMHHEVSTKPADKSFVDAESPQALPQDLVVEDVKSLPILGHPAEPSRPVSCAVVASFLGLIERIGRRGDPDVISKPSGMAEAVAASLSATSTAGCATAGYWIGA